MRKDENLYDVAIIGGGPAGLTAAIYLARAHYRVLVLEKEHFGGQITITSEVVNYPGIEKTSGNELTQAMRRQAEHFGAEFLLAQALSLDANGKIKMVKTTRGDIRCFGILLATGAHPRMIGFKGEGEYRGHGVAYCATCDGEFFTGLDVFVVGGGFAAAEESVFLTKYARHVTILVREENFTCAPTVAQPALESEKITVHFNTEVVEASGDGEKLTRLVYRNNKSGEQTEYTPQTGESFGIFVFAGYEPETSLVRGIAECDESGYVITDKNQKTTCDGLYAAGDVCIKSLRQVVTAVGDGALAASELEKYAHRMQKETGLLPAFKGIKSEEEKVNDTNLFSSEMLSQLKAVFERMSTPLILELHTNESSLSAELNNYISELASLTDKLSVVKSDKVLEDMPVVRVMKNNTWTGLAFHGVPGGHEFTSFVLGLYNASGPGQSLDEPTANEARKIPPTEMKILVSLSCTMCPELVTAAQKIASLNENVSAEVYDLNHYSHLRKKYSVMSVPCLIAKQGEKEKVYFGKKSIPELIKLLSS